MTNFYQQNQNVGFQQNAGGDINQSGSQINSHDIYGIQDKAQLIEELRTLKTELAKAVETEVLDAEIFVDSDYQVTKAIQQIEKESPDKKGVMNHLKNAKSFLEGVTSVGAIVKAIDQISLLVMNLL
ncbi:hypothetical protein ACQ4N7_16265 [Nodosilinea sp. AN01ver1]|uniref:hypothetical protein n=1 Tax=Nodosilinea sp. AN01ver1 TaxID=3423362 RepID=UPI003D322695